MIWRYGEFILFLQRRIKRLSHTFIIIMEKYKYNTVADFLEALNMTREDIKEMIAKSTIHLSTNCEKNFDGSPEVTEEVAQPFYYLLEIIDNVA